MHVAIRHRQHVKSGPPSYACLSYETVSEANLIKKYRQKLTLWLTFGLVEVDKRCGFGAVNLEPESSSKVDTHTYTKIYTYIPTHSGGDRHAAGTLK